MTKECICIDSNCCALCSMFSCNCPPGLHEAQDRQREKCPVHKSREPKFKDYGKAVLIPKDFK